MIYTYEPAPVHGRHIDRLRAYAVGEGLGFDVLGWLDQVEPYARVKFWVYVDDGMTRAQFLAAARRVLDHVLYGEPVSEGL